MLKISLENSSGRTVTLRLEGRITGAWTEELRKACNALLDEDRTVTLNLAEVGFADREAVMLLRELADGGVALTECSPFTAEQLKAL